MNEKLLKCIEAFAVYNVATDDETQERYEQFEIAFENLLEKSLKFNMGDLLIKFIAARATL